ncbi:MAG: hypothetical protein FJ044_02235 [Candidatus Cloacimonetes bacterium]|nr:hypothetical protein [Candidatus Cloacimonadota bacterium]
MSQLQTLDQTLNRKLLVEQAQIFYDIKGKPTSVILPFKVFKKIYPQKDGLTVLLEESARIAKEEKISLKEVLSALEEVREEMYKEYYA